MLCHLHVLPLEPGRVTIAPTSAPLSLFFKVIISHSSLSFALVQSLSHVQHFCDSMNCSPPGSSVHGISQARILEWVAISFSKGSSQPRGQTCISCLAYRFFTTEPPGKPLNGLLVSKTEFLCFLKVWAPRFRRLEQEDSHRLRTRKPEPTSPVCHSQGV